MLTFFKYFSKDICLPHYTSPLNGAIRSAIAVSLAVMGFASVFLAGFGWEKVLPTSIYSAFHSSFHHLDLLTAGIWKPDANQACRQVTWTDLSFKHYLVHVNAWMLQRCILSNGQQVAILTPWTNLSSSFLLLGTLALSLQHPGSFSVPAAAWVQTQSRR